MSDRLVEYTLRAAGILFLLFTAMLGLLVFYIEEEHCRKKEEYLAWRRRQNGSYQ